MKRITYLLAFLALTLTAGAQPNLTYSTKSTSATMPGDSVPVTGALTVYDSSGTPAAVSATQPMPSALYGTTDQGDATPIASTGEGHLEVAIHSPRLPFGSVHTESLTPVFQSDAVYLINSGIVEATTSLTGNVAVANSSYTISTGNTSLSSAALQSRKRLRYRAGQGIVARWTAQYTEPVANSYQLSGLGHAEDGFYFGYGNTGNLSDTRFGILYVARGKREIQTLTVTTGANVTGNVTVELGGSGNFTVPVTNSGNTLRTAYEISRGTYTGWDAEPRGATVVFVANSAGNKAGNFTLTGGATNAAGTLAETVAGVSSTDTFIPQSTWNGDKMDGTGSSGVTILPAKYNVFQILMQYLGAGAIAFQVEVAPANGNNAEWVTVHTLRFPNTLTESIVGNPSFPFTAAVYSAGSTTNLTVKVASFAGFVEGAKMLHGNRYSYLNINTGVTDSAIRPLFTFLNSRYYSGRTNQSVVNLLSAMGAIKHTSPVVYYLIRGGTLTGNPNFTTFGNNSCTFWDTASTAVTYANNEQLIWTGHLGDTGDIDHHFSNGNLEEVTVQPGEFITLGARATTGNPSYVTGSINTREDQ